MATKRLCRHCASVNWLEAGLPRVSPAESSLFFSSSEHIRMPTGEIAQASDRRLTDASQFLFDAGILSDIRTRAPGCQSCAFFLELVERHFLPSDIRRAAEQSAKLHVYTNTHGTATCADKDGTQSFNVMRFELAFGSAFDCGGSAAFVLPGFGNAESDPATLMGRSVSPRVDPDRIIHWMNRCTSQHEASTAAHPESGFLSYISTSGTLRVVDVDERCLKTIPMRDPEKRYAALSYVWGVNDQAVSLTTSNHSDFSMEGGIPKLSQTIEDAIEVAKAVGLRYFWCDVISILQDDAEDKKANIFDMDKVYTWSSLTIVALAGETCHEGLYGVSRDRTPLLQTAIAADVKLVEVPDQPRRPYRTLRATSGWPTRAWTLQEFVMSRKTLLFCEQQTLWICRDTDWAEDLDLEGESYRFSNYSGLNRPALKSSVFSDENNMKSTKQPESQAVEAANELSDAMTLIECFSGRKLTYDNDVKNALEGLTWFMASLSPDSLPGFLWGLPESGFEAFLCWYTRADRNCSRGVVSRRTTFAEAPSWSWMAWLGEVRLPRFALSKHGRTWKSIVKCYKYPTYVRRQGREPDIIPSGYEAEDTIITRSYNIMDGGLPLESQSEKLVFWAEHAKVSLDVKSLDIHFEKYASSISSANGKRVCVQSLNVSERLAQDIRDLGIVDITIVGLAIEKSTADDLPIDYLEEKADCGECHPFDNWSRTVHCLLVSNPTDNHIQREGFLTMRPADWHDFNKTVELLILE